VLVAGSSLADSIGWPKSKPELLSTKQEQLEAKLQNFYSNFASVHSSTFTSFIHKSQTSDLGLYPVVDSISWLERLLKKGVSIIQYREKKLSGDDLESAIKQAIALGKQYNARLFINDHWQLAIKYNAYGVHLGQEDIQTADLNAIKSANLRLGISTHGHYELLKVQQYKPSYLAIGAIFPTKTKDMTGQIQGVHTLKQLVDLTPHIPTVAIGGITLEKAPSVLNTNVDSIAVVTAITEASNPEYAVDQFQQLFLQLKSKH
jgi:hydroxymethylpyrimidine kinase/phosphomethylpyrimidine kinase/thiamine-phosphate diphosphorylase